MPQRGRVRGPRSARRCLSIPSCSRAEETEGRPAGGTDGLADPAGRRRVLIWSPGLAPRSRSPCSARPSARAGRPGFRPRISPGSPPGDAHPSSHAPARQDPDRFHRGNRGGRQGRIGGQLGSEDEACRSFTPNSSSRRHRRPGSPPSRSSRPPRPPPRSSRTSRPRSRRARAPPSPIPWTPVAWWTPSARRAGRCALPGRHSVRPAGADRPVRRVTVAPRCPKNDYRYRVVRSFRVVNASTASPGGGSSFHVLVSSSGCPRCPPWIPRCCERLPRTGFRGDRPQAGFWLVTARHVDGKHARATWQKGPSWLRGSRAVTPSVARRWQTRCCPPRHHRGPHAPCAPQSGDEVERPPLLQHLVTRRVSQVLSTGSATPRRPPHRRRDSVLRLIRADEPLPAPVVDEVPEVVADSRTVTRAALARRRRPFSTFSVVTLSRAIGLLVKHRLPQANGLAIVAGHRRPHGHRRHGDRRAVAEQPLGMALTLGAGSQAAGSVRGGRLHLGRLGSLGRSAVVAALVIIGLGLHDRLCAAAGRSAAVSPWPSPWPAG